MVKTFLFFVPLVFFLYPVYCQIPDCEVLKYVTYVKMDENKLVQTDSFVIQVNTRMGETFTEMNVHYSRMKKVSNLVGWIEDAGGTLIRSLKSSDITDKSAISDFSLYEDEFVKTFQLKHNTYPYRIFYSYQTTLKQFTSVEWQPVFNRKLPTRTGSFTLQTPRNFAVHLYQKNISALKTDTSELSITYRWEANYTKPVKKELFSMPHDTIPFVVVAPDVFTYGISGSSKNWQTFGNWYYRLTDKLDDLPETERLTVSNLIKGVKDQKRIVKILYHYLQDHTRYINVTTDVGGLKPYPASYVAANKYGDCKALTNYMRALLNYAGIKSYLALIDADWLPDKIVKEVPFPQFNHVILAVPVQKDTIWLENTSNTLPFGYVHSSIQNREAFLIDENNSHFIRVPALNRNAVKSFSHVNVIIRDSGRVDITLMNTYRGEDFEFFNGLNENYDNHEQDERMRKYSSFDLKNWKLVKTDRDSAFITLTSVLTNPRFLKPVGSDKYFGFSGTSLPPFESPAERTLPLCLPFPVYEEDTVTYVLPAGYKVKTVPENVQHSCTFGNYQVQFIPSHELIKEIRTFELFSGSYPLKQYSGFYSFLEFIRNTEKKIIVLKKKNT